MRYSKTNLYITFILVCSVVCNLAKGDTVVQAVNSPADLDLSGDIVLAINFGNDGNPNVGGVVFSQAQECPAITLDALGEGPATWWGPYPGTGHAGLDQLLNGLAYRWGTPPNQISIAGVGLVTGKPYLLQMIGYEPEDHGRNIDIIVNGEQIATGLNPIAQQGGVAGQGGFVVKHEFTADDPVWNVRLVSHNDACAISALILTEMTEGATLFADHGSGTTVELAVGKGVWQINWGQGPWTWFNSTDAPLLDANVSGILDLRTTAPADINADLVATLPIEGKLTLSAHDAISRDAAIGTMVLTGSGINAIDINAGRVIVDEGSGMCLAPFPASAPKITLSLQEATGVFAYIQQVEEWELSFAGSYAAPLMEGVALQDNIFAALAGDVPLIGGIGTFALSGAYVPDETKRAKAFCAFGKAHALSITPAQGSWEQTWGEASHDWFDCQTPTDASFLLDDVVGRLETMATGAPDLDADFILRIPLKGTLTLTDFNGVDSSVIDGQIIADIETLFVADLNADRATIDPQGNVVTVFGAGAQDELPVAKVTVREMTGIYANIEPIQDWKFYVNGTFTGLPVPGLSLQESILAALQNPELIASAEEEIVLAGSYLNVVSAGQ